MADLHGFLRDAGGGLGGVLGGGQIRCMNVGMDSCMDFGMRAAWICPSWFRPGFIVFLDDGKSMHTLAVFSCCFSCSLGDVSCT